MLHTTPVRCDSAFAWNILNICMPQTTLLFVGLVAAHSTCSVVLVQSKKATAGLHLKLAATACNCGMAHVCLYCTPCMLHETAWNSSVYMAVPCAHL